MYNNRDRSISLLLLVLFLASFFSSCKWGNREVSASLDCIEQVVEQHPDSALIELVRLDSLIDAGAVSIEGDLQMARYALLKTQTHDKNWIDDTNDSLILSAVRYYDDHGSKRERMLAHFYHGAIFRNAKDYGAAFVAYRQAEQLALELDDDHYLCLIYGNLSSLSSKTYSKDAIMYSHKNLNYARMSHDRRESFLAMSDMAKNYSTQLKYDTAEFWFRQIFDSLPVDDRIVQSSLTFYIEQCMTTEQYHFADSLLNLLKRPIRRPVDLMNKACLFQIKGLNDSADVYINLAERAIRTPEQWVFFYEKRSWIAKKRGAHAEALELMHNRFEAQNDVITSIFSKSVSDYQRNYELQQKNYTEYRYSVYRRWSVIVAAFCLLSAIIVFAYLYYVFKSRNKKLNDKIKDYLEQNLLMEKQKVSMKALEFEIETLQQKLENVRSTSMTRKLSRLIVNRFSIFDRLGIIFFEKQGKLEFKQKMLEAVDEEVKRLCSDDKTIGEIDQIIDNYFDGAMTKAKMTDLRLTNADVNFLRYILMGFSYETIAYLFDKNNMEALYTRKKRLKRKLKQAATPQANELLACLTTIKENLGEDKMGCTNSSES